MQPADVYVPVLWGVATSVVLVTWLLLRPRVLAAVNRRGGVFLKASKLLYPDALTEVLVYTDVANASDPGRVALDGLTYRSQRGVVGTWITVLIFAGFGGGILGGYTAKNRVSAISVAVVIPSLIVVSLRRTSPDDGMEAFAMRGDTLPGVVIDRRQGLAAVLTDMTKGRGFFPAVYLFEHPRIRLLRKGERFPALASYCPAIPWIDPKTGAPRPLNSNGEILALTSPDAWMNLFPVPVSALSDRPATIRRVQGGISKDRWSTLEQAVKLLRPSAAKNRPLWLVSKPQMQQEFVPGHVS